MKESAFITGSRAYGEYSTLDSDTDLVIRCDEETRKLLAIMAVRHGHTDPFGKASTSVKFGQLNLIMCTDDKTYSTWKAATEVVKHMPGKLSKDIAANVFRRLFKLAGLIRSGYEDTIEQERTRIDRFHY